MLCRQSPLAPYTVIPSSYQNDDLELALALSRAQVLQDEERREQQQQEDDELERILKLSLVEK